MWRKLPTYATNYGVTYAIVVRGVSAVEDIERIEKERLNLLVMFKVSLYCSTFQSLQWQINSFIFEAMKNLFDYGGTSNFSARVSEENVYKMTVAEQEIIQQLFHGCCMIGQKQPL